MDLPEYESVTTCYLRVPMTTCPACTSELPPDAAFCSACGYRARAKRGSLVGITINDRYQINARLAAGGFGAIYRATHIITGRDVALKVLHADLASDPSLSARFRREGAMLASLRDPHTVSTYELGEAPDGTLYIAMELLRGDSLWDRFNVNGTLPWRKVLNIIRGVCSSLVEAHGLGIVHRDLKPANIHLEPGPEEDFVKVLDFGIAKLMTGSQMDDGSELTRIGTAVGTLDYMAPEQLIGGACDGRTDIYTLGVVMYEMITGQRPFADASGPTSLITALFTRTPTPLSIVSNVPPALDGVVLKCLEREPSDRYTSVQELIAAIEQMLYMHAPAPSPMSQIRTLAGHPIPDRMFAGEEITIRERPLTIEDAALVEDTAVEPIGQTMGRLPTAPVEYAAGTASELIAPSPVTQDAWQGSNLTLVWPPVLPSAHEEPTPSPFELARGSTVDAKPIARTPRPTVEASGTRVPEIVWHRVLLTAILLLVAGVAIGAIVASAL
jgi:eukaryotic-like serine/threonine-protein kinase